MPKSKLLTVAAPETLQLIKDLKANAKSLNRLEAVNLVRTYYQLQKIRIIQGNRAGALERAKLAHAHQDTLNQMFSELEKEVTVWLDVYAHNHPVGKWMLNQHGIGPVLASAVLSYIDIEKAPNASSVHSYFGLNPMQFKVKGQKLNFDPERKSIAWKIGESFVKVSYIEEAFYGKEWIKRKNQEWSNNIRGNYAHLIGQRNYTYGEDTESFKWTSGQFVGVTEDNKGILPGASPKPGDRVIDRNKTVQMIPPASIHERSKRWTAKLFLSHVWEKLYEDHYKTKAPLPYPVAKLGHDTYIPPPE